MKPASGVTLLLLLAACASTRPPPNIVVSHASTEAFALPIATKYCAQYKRVAVFNSKLGDAFQFDCVSRPR